MSAEFARGYQLDAEKGKAGEPSLPKAEQGRIVSLREGITQNM
jgi:hypothetical protein